MPIDAERQRNSALLDNGRQGFLYLLTNPSMPGLIKAGCTRKHPLQRVKELCAATGVPTAFELAYYRDFADCFLAERLFHEHFDAVRVNDAREFFAVSVPEAVAFVDGLVNSSHYRGLASQGVSGGEIARPVVLPPTPWAELFANFDQDGPAELNADEQAQCRELARKLGQ